MNPLLAAPSLDPLVTLVIFVAISALSAWLKRKQKQKESDALPAPPPVRRRPGETAPKPASNWEEELRKLLEGEPAQAPPPPPPIVVYEERSVPPPLPPVATLPQSARPFPPAEEEGQGGWEGTLLPPTHATATIEQASHLDDRVEERLRQRGSMAESTARLERASHLEQAVEAHFRQISLQGSRFSATGKERARTPHATQAMALVRDPQGIRAALIASLFLGPPKALER